MTLKSDITNDLDTFINPNEFADAAIYNNNTICGIFTDAYKGIDLATGEIESTDPQYETKASNIIAIGHGDTLIINGVTYYVISIQPDGTGFVLLTFSRDAP